jgi:hypothetical protein
MGKHRIKPNYRRRVPRLPDLDHCKLAVLNGLGSPASRRVYEHAIDQFIAWYCSEPRLAFNRIVPFCWGVAVRIAGSKSSFISPFLACSQAKGKLRNLFRSSLGGSARQSWARGYDFV